MESLKYKITNPHLKSKVAKKHPAGKEKFEDPKHITDIGVKY
jgi:hypothetical protein